ncbi:MAG: hypothetical protein U0893_12805 [Chloroflexota bacterium]
MRSALLTLDVNAGVMGGRLRPYAVHAAIAVYFPCLLVADAWPAALWQQYGLGVVTFTLLLALLRGSDAAERRQVWLCVVLATALEVFASMVWGVYTYRFGNVPLFVPPGHGLVYLFGLRTRRTPLAVRSGSLVTGAALAAATLWAAGGVTVLPAWTGRWDVAGACWWPILAYCLLRSRNGVVYAAIFAVTAELELIGTGLGNWTWVGHLPLLLIPVGNPPSAIAGGYCVLDGAATRLARRLAGIRPPVAAPIEAPALGQPG